MRNDQQDEQRNLACNSSLEVSYVLTSFLPLFSNWLSNDLAVPGALDVERPQSYLRHSVGDSLTRTEKDRVALRILVSRTSRMSKLPAAQEVQQFNHLGQSLDSASSSFALAICSYSISDVSRPICTARSQCGKDQQMSSVTSLVTVS